jgi:hypothetical protein
MILDAICGSLEYPPAMCAEIGFLRIHGKRPAMAEHINYFKWLSVLFGVFIVLFVLGYLVY